MLHRLFRPRPAQAAGRALYAACVDQARAPALYVDYAIPDTAEGRFETYTLHVVLLIERLQPHGPQAAETSQVVFDTYVKALDHGLRELGVGDLSVGKKMRKLGEAIYGRVKNAHAAFAALPDVAPLEALLARTVYAGQDGDEAAARAARLAAYVAAQRQALAAQPLDDLLAGRLHWSAP